MVVAEIADSISAPAERTGGVKWRRQDGDGFDNFLNRPSSLFVVSTQRPRSATQFTQFPTAAFSIVTHRFVRFSLPFAAAVAVLSRQRRLLGVR